MSACEPEPIDEEEAAYRARVRAWVISSRRKQGKPDQVEDPVVLAQLADFADPRTAT